MRQLQLTSVKRSFFETTDPITLAAALLGKVLWKDDKGLILTEVEVYLQTDPASHSFKGRTASNAAMFAAAGTFYVYLCYGLHHCANVVTGKEGVGEGILLRAGWPLGIKRRGARWHPEGREDWTEQKEGGQQKIKLEKKKLVRGPGRFSRELGISKAAHNKADLLQEDSTVRLLELGWRPLEVSRKKRKGLSKAQEKKWNFSCLEFTRAH